MSNYLNGGYEKKYIIEKANGNPIEPGADYFVFRLDKDPYALDALYVYACSLTYVNPELSKDLLYKISVNQEIQRTEGIKKLPRGPLR